MMCLPLLYGIIWTEDSRIPLDAGRRRLELFGEDHNIRPGWVTVGSDLTSSNFNRQVHKPLDIPLTLWTAWCHRDCWTIGLVACIAIDKSFEANLCDHAMPSGAF